MGFGALAKHDRVRTRMNEISHLPLLHCSVVEPSETIANKPMERWELLRLFLKAPSHLISRISCFCVNPCVSQISDFSTWHCSCYLLPISNGNHSKKLPGNFDKILLN